MFADVEDITVILLSSRHFKIINIILKKYGVVTVANISEKRLGLQFGIQTDKHIASNSDMDHRTDGPIKVPG